MRAAALAGLALAAILVHAPDPARAQAYPDASLPTPTGPWAVGRRTIVIADSVRTETLGPFTGGPRTLRVRLWYPTDAVEGPTIPYMDAPTAATWVERHGFPEGFQDRVRTFARDDVPLAETDDPWPLLVFSHGMSWPADMYQAFLDEMASLGYVVAAVDHTGWSDAIVFPDGTVAGFDAAWSPRNDDGTLDRVARAAPMRTWLADLRFALDSIERLADMGEPFFGRVSTERVGAFGHSYGGGAATRLLVADPRVVAAANLEGSAYLPDTLPFTVDEPLLHVVGGYNESLLVATEFVPDDAPLYEVIVHGAFHSTFSDLIHLHTFKADDAWKARHRYDHDPARALSITNDFLRAFFDRYLKGIDGDREDLLHLRSMEDLESAATRGYPEVEVRLDY